MTFPTTTEVRLEPKIDAYVRERIGEESKISIERQEELLKLSRYVKRNHQAGKPVKLLFVCTHNSRRSHLAQLWAKISAVYFGIEKVETYSGGTETTAMNPRTVAALQRVGLEIIKSDSDPKNPRYSITYGKSVPAEVCFSKTLTEAPNPTSDFAAIMTCSSADKSCPNVKGCELRLALPYEDPKAADDTPEELSTYDAKSKEIAREMIFVMSRVHRVGL